MHNDDDDVSAKALAPVCKTKNDFLQDVDQADPRRARPPASRRARIGSPVREKYTTTSMIYNIARLALPESARLALPGSLPCFAGDLAFCIAQSIR